MIFFSSSYDDRQNTIDVGNKMAHNQSTPVDIEYSLERYNLIKRAYWVNGQREKALTLPSPVKRPLGYITLFTENGGIVVVVEISNEYVNLHNVLSFRRTEATHIKITYVYGTVLSYNLGTVERAKEKIEEMILKLCNKKEEK